MFSGPFRIGGAKRDRTADLYNAIVALSQLSYGPSRCAGGWGRPAQAEVFKPFVATTQA
jgi:hypothetical protein